MAKKREARILFFTSDALPTEREQQLADLLGSNVGFRVGRMAKTGKAEACDGVAAAKAEFIPHVYAVNNVPRVKTYDDVRRLKPAFARDVGYTDEDDYGDIDVSTAGPSNEEGEPKPDAQQPDTDSEDDDTEDNNGGTASEDDATAGSRRTRRKAANEPPAAPATAPAAGTPPAAAQQPSWGMPPAPPVPPTGNEGKTT